MNIEQIAKETWSEVSKSSSVGQSIAVTFAEALLKKLAERIDMKPAAWQGKSGHLVYDKAALMPSTRHLSIALYAETKLIAAQQKSAEACANAVFEQAKYFGYSAHAEAVRYAALNKWREYL